MTSPPMISIQNLCFQRRHEKVLNNVRLDIKVGQRVAIVGPNGAGKTTLLKCLNRILTGWTGSIRIAGRELKEYHQRELAAWMAYVPQTCSVSSPFTVETFIAMGRYAYQGPWVRPNKRDRMIVDAALELTDTTHLRERVLTQLSGGENQRVLLAAALAQESQILLLDEPTAFLDPRHETAFQQALNRVHEEREMTVVTVTHDLNRAVLMHDSVVALRGGEVVYAGSPQTFINQDILQCVYGTSFLIVEHHLRPQQVVLPEVAV